MARYGHCKSCWWWNQTGEKIGICWFQTRGWQDNPHYSGIDEYCPDHSPRIRANKQDGTLKRWLEHRNLKYVTYKKCIKL